MGRVRGPRVGRVLAQEGGEQRLRLGVTSEALEEHGIGRGGGR
jgi:hypothetical protein